MRVLALNSSPRTKGQSKTELMLNHLVQGMRDAGAEFMTLPVCKELAKNVLAATVQAGRELVVSGQVSPETMARIRQPLADLHSNGSNLRLTFL